MARPPHRRTFLKHVAAAAAGTCLVGGTARATRAAPSSSDATPETRPSPQADGLSAYAYQSQVWIRSGEDVFTCYRANPAQKYPYFYPVFGPASGLPMTEESGVPYPHHRSMFLACDHVNGGDYWQEGVERGQIISRGPKVEADSPERVVVADECDWRQPGQPPIIADHRRYSITAPRAAQRLIDVDVTLTASVDVHVTRTNHSLFAIRAARALSPRGGGVLLNATGQTGEQATFGQAAAWCGYHGTRLGITESIVLIDHPGNPWSPCRWFTRDYGFISPTPFYWLDDAGWRLAAGESVRLRYRIVVSEGLIVPEDVRRLHEALAASE